ncbi:hypothetical protein AZ78_4795 [Lysobacter capsici AZ78]|uniref:Uncharacterized protein n=1 Tax=Lysobacter capsici AZ78 TaxID=1444315 RepID=A0A108UE06_9GAMM|nr:hypothetical protein AZ78_4795 [Lysobacter capsici AZ78]
MDRIQGFSDARSRCGRARRRSSSAVFRCDLARVAIGSEPIRRCVSPTRRQAAIARSRQAPAWQSHAAIGKAVRAIDGSREG